MKKTLLLTILLLGVAMVLGLGATGPAMGQESPPPTKTPVAGETGPPPTKTPEPTATAKGPPPTKTPTPAPKGGDDGHGHDREEEPPPPPPPTATPTPTATGTPTPQPTPATLPVSGGRGDDYPAILVGLGLGLLTTGVLAARRAGRREVSLLCLAVVVAGAAVTSGGMAWTATTAPPPVLAQSGEEPPPPPKGGDEQPPPPKPAGSDEQPPPPKPASSDEQPPPPKEGPGDEQPPPPKASPTDTPTPEPPPAKTPQPERPPTKTPLPTPTPKGSDGDGGEGPPPPPPPTDTPVPAATPTVTATPTPRPTRPLPTPKPTPAVFLTLVEGVVYQDDDGDQVRDAGENGVGGARVTASDGEATETTVTGSDGRYRIRWPEDRMVELEVEPPRGYDTVLGLASRTIVAGEDAGDFPLRKVPSVGWTSPGWLGTALTVFALVWAIGFSGERIRHAILTHTQVTRELGARQAGIYVPGETEAVITLNQVALDVTGQAMGFDRVAQVRSRPPRIVTMSADYEECVFTPDAGRPDRDSGARRYTIDERSAGPLAIDELRHIYRSLAPEYGVGTPPVVPRNGRWYLVVTPTRNEDDG